MTHLGYWNVHGNVLPLSRKVGKYPSPTLCSDALSRWVRWTLSGESVATKRHTNTKMRTNTKNAPRPKEPQTQKCAQSHNAPAGKRAPKTYKIQPYWLGESGPPPPLSAGDSRAPAPCAQRSVRFCASCSFSDCLRLAFSSALRM